MRESIHKYFKVGLIAFLENNLNPDGSVRIPEALRVYMGGKSVIGGRES
jgi:seryl-tRNA synthetase